MNKAQFEILRYLIETDKGYSLENIGINLENLIDTEDIDYLVEKQYISRVNSDYKHTKIGLNIMEKYQVDNAIIMAAGFGSRFVPYTYITPKGLINVNGEVLIERQIKQLKEVGINEIFIVVGYLKEQFEYLISKYGVKLIENKDFSEKNNISSIYYANKCSVLSNSYILTSDIIMTKNIYHRYEYQSWYALKFFDGFTEEWNVQMNEHDMITSVTTEGSDSLAMYGPVFFTQEFSKIISNKIAKLYSDPEKSQYYWENVYVDFIEELELYGKEFSSDLIFEFEDFSELIAYDESYNESPRNPMIELITDIFKIEPKEIIGIQPLKVGMTNDSFAFEVKGEKFVYRIAGEGTSELLNRYQEAEVYKNISHLNLADEVIYINPDNGTKIAKFIDNGSSVDESYLPFTIKILKQLHNSGIEVSHKFDILERLDFYTDLCRKNNAITYSKFADLEIEVLEIKEFIRNQNIPYVFCHCDGVVVNFLNTESGLRLLDWEYAGMSDPYIDLTMNVLYSNLSFDQTNNLLDMYLGREATLVEKKRLYGLISLTGMLWSLWVQYKQIFGETFGDYGLEQYKYSWMYLNYFKEILL